MVGYTACARTVAAAVPELHKGKGGVSFEANDVRLGLGFIGALPPTSNDQVWRERPGTDVMFKLILLGCGPKWIAWGGMHVSGKNWFQKADASLCVISRLEKPSFLSLLMK